MITVINNVDYADKTSALYIAQVIPIPSLC